jgi:hypothetical protein
MGMSKSDAGRLGAIKSATTKKENAEKRREYYNNNPVLCHKCQNPLEYKKKKYKFCSRSCSASSSNQLVPKRKRTVPRCTSCKECSMSMNKRQNRNSVGFCSMNCFLEYRFKHELTPNVEAGIISDRPMLKRYITKTRGKICVMCNNTTWNNVDIPLELDHIDGDAGNNFPNNLRLLCPNCHAQTPTAKGRNRGNGRKSRGLPHN